MTSTDQSRTAAAHSAATAPTVTIYVRSAQPDAARMQARAAALQAKAEDSGWTVSAIILETRQRSISDQMLDALTGYDVVLVDGLSQLTRNMSRALEVMERLQAADVRLVTGPASTAVGSVSDQEATAALRLLMTVLAEADREAHSRRIKTESGAARARQEEVRR